MSYNHQEIEKKWQQKWSEEGVYQVAKDDSKDKYYVLDMFPYPSGAGLHVGHPRGYIATDILARYKRQQGYNVLHPMGWDAFGLPAENYALKHKTHPKESTDRNIANYKSQLKSLGFSYDWSREINTTDPDYYKWTQWAFIRMFEKGLVYRSQEPINWCPSCKTGLANEDLEGGLCERCGSQVEKKPLPQWVIRITDYADRLLKDLSKLEGWEESIKEMQKNWIGRSEGAEIVFQIEGEKVPVFTTRPDTIFGATYIVLSPEHELVEKLSDKIKNIDEVKEYIETAKAKTDLERTDLNKEKTGVRLAGVIARNPVSGEEMPVFAADYVLSGYGSGAIMAVPAHDERDWEFARKYDLPIRKVVEPEAGEADGCYAGAGKAVNSDFLDGLETAKAKAEIIDRLEAKGLGSAKVTYKLKDWVFSRQRYWGEPIPLVHCDKCGVVPVNEDDLPLKLPQVESYEPSGTGESPLKSIDEWVKTECPKCGGPAERETNTMPQWAGSCWYYLRYIDPDNSRALVGQDKEKYWMPVDFYVGGAEHATRHLIYARFWHKFLYDIGAVSTDEPFVRLRRVGLILAEDGRKMSKRWGNVINPDDVVKNQGADALRLYEMFMGPFSEPIAWSENGLAGARKFLDKIYYLSDKAAADEDSRQVLEALNRAIAKVGNDIESFKFNTAVSAMMILANKLSEAEGFTKESFGKFLRILSPFAPHLSQELWSKLGGKGLIIDSAWPETEDKYLKASSVSLVVQINGKLRDTVEVETGIGEEEAKQEAMSSEKVAKWLEGKEIVKVIFVPDKLINLVVK